MIQMKQRVQRVNLKAEITQVHFNELCGEYLVKNFSDGDIYVSFESNVSDNQSIKIPSKSYQICVVNCYLGGLDYYKSKDIFMKGHGEVEVQQLCWH